ncbi:MAG: hypothetical protein KGJ73_10620 [Rhodospirillales bacterium]|nr:hypothetical protein [Rhodospirillales bacterium]
MQASDSQQFEDKRKMPRSRVLMGGKVYVGVFSPTVHDGLTVDLSEAGGCFQMHGLTLVPEQFKVRIGLGDIRRVRRCWVSGTAIGFEFLDAA